jgi:hypothetical protein
MISRIFLSASIFASPFRHRLELAQREDGDLRRRKRDQGGHPPVGPRMAVPGDDHDRRAMGVERGQRRLRQRRVAQALRLDEPRQDVLRQRVAVGLLLLRFPHLLLGGVERCVQPEPRGIARKHGRRPLREGAARLLSRHLGTVDGDPGRLLKHGIVHGKIGPARLGPAQRSRQCVGITGQLAW